MVRTKPWNTTDAAGSGWRRLLAIYALASFVEGLYVAHLVAFLPMHLLGLGVAQHDVPTWVGVITALANAAGLPLLPFWGALADRYTRKPLVVRSFAVLCVSAVIMALGGRLWIFVVGRAVVSLAQGNSGLMLATLAESVPRQRVGLAFAIVNAAIPLGIFLGPPLGGALFDVRGFRGVLALDACLLGAVTALLLVGYTDRYVAPRRESVVRMAADTLRIVTRDRRIRLLLSGLLVLLAGWLAAYSYVPLLVERLYEGEDLGRVVGLVMGASGLSTLLFSPTMGLLADRLGPTRVFRTGGLALTLLFATALLADGLWTFALAWSVLTGIATGLFSIGFLFLSDTAEEALRGRVMSFSYLPTVAGFILGPGLASLTVQWSLWSVFPLGAALTAIGMAIVGLSTRRRGAPAAVPR